MHRGKTLCRHREKKAVYKLRKRPDTGPPLASEGTSPAHTLISDLWLPDCKKIHLFCLSAWVLCTLLSQVGFVSKLTHMSSPKPSINSMDQLLEKKKKPLENKSASLSYSFGFYP